MQHNCKTMGQIRQGKLFEIAEALDSFSITWITEHGHRHHEENAVCTSFHSEGDTMNIKSPTMERPVTVILDTIVEFAGKEVVL